MLNIPLQYTRFLLLRVYMYTVVFWAPPLPPPPPAQNFLLNTERRNAKRDERKVAIIGILTDKGLGEEPNTMTAKRLCSFLFLFVLKENPEVRFLGWHRYYSLPCAIGISGFSNSLLQRQCYKS
jgi:hypothetical protein